MWRLAVLALSLTLIFFAAQVVVLTGTWLAYPGEAADPFAPYETVMPGQLVALSDYPCDPPTPEIYVLGAHCEIHPDSSYITLVSVSIHNARFVQTGFSGQNLYIGDVVRRWGRPDVIKRNDKAFFVFWNNRGLIGIIDPDGPISRFDYMVPIERFTISLQQFNNTP